MSSKTDLMYEITYNPKFVPKHAPKVNVKTILVKDKETYVMKNHVTANYYDLDEVSYEVWKLIDGKRTLAEIGKEIQKKWPDVESDTIERVMLFLAEANCLDALVERPRKRRIKVPSAFEIDVVLVKDSKAFLRGVHKVSRFLLKTPFLWASLVFIIVFVVLFAGQFTAIYADSSRFRIFGSTVVGFFFYSFLVLGPIIAVHEVAHGLALVHYGGTPGEIGTGLFYFSPMFYIDSTDAWTIPRRQRIMVMMAGNISTLLIASTIVAIGYIFPYPASVSNLLYMAAFFCFYATLLNIAPPFETDGYYVLADLVNIPDLRPRSYGYVKSLFKKAFGLKVEEDALQVDKPKILVGFAILSVAWIVYTVFQTSLFTYYMLGDAQASFLSVYAAIVSSQALTLTVALISVASVLYFGMTVSGYGVVLIAAVKKALKPHLKFEAIHDRDLSMFFYIPEHAEAVHEKFENEIKKDAKKVTQNYQVKRFGPVLTATLRMGGTKAALDRIDTDLRRIEQDFNSAYQKFIRKHSSDILRTADTHGPSKDELETSLKKIGNEIANAGMPEARNAVKEMIDLQNSNAVYLLNSATGSVWSVELPPSSLHEAEQTLLPSLFVEDFTITDLYRGTEEFKKRTVYGFDSISKVTNQNHQYLLNALRNPTECQLVSCFEPVKSRLLFVGRTEKIEKDIPLFSGLFVGQVWCGYTDSLLSEANLTLSTLRIPPALSLEDIAAMRDEELFVLKQNLSLLTASERLVTRALDRSGLIADQVTDNIEGLKTHFEKNKLLQHNSMDVIYSINGENLARIPRRLEEFREKFQRSLAFVEEIANAVGAESHKREGKAKKKEHRILHTYPIIVILSIALVLAGLYFWTGLLEILFLALAFLIHGTYWILYFSRLRRRFRPGRYPSRSFMNVELFALALTQVIYKFVATVDIVAPPHKTVLEAQHKKKRN